MSYPKKICRDTILDAALAFIETAGLAELSMRTLAANLGVTPNALYRYFANKAALEFAMADEGGRLLLRELRVACEGLPPPDAVRALAHAYVRFAQSKPQLYAVKMRHAGGAEPKPGSHDEVWHFVMQLASALPTRWDARDLAMALWAFLHGMVALDQANLLEGQPALTAIDVGLDVMMAGLMTGLRPPA